MKEEAFKVISEELKAECACFESAIVPTISKWVDAHNDSHHLLLGQAICNVLLRHAAHLMSQMCKEVGESPATCLEKFADLSLEVMKDTLNPTGDGKVVNLDEMLRNRRKEEAN